MAVNDFNRIAPLYNRISRLVFGDRLLEAQVHFLDHVNEDAKVLILGGGTGEILSYLPACREVHFLEKSERMIDLARQHTVSLEVDFLHKDFLSYNADIKYDFIICPFFLDCFGEINLVSVLDKIQSILRKDGYLLVTDFQYNGFNSMILKVMHLFFRISANLEARKLLDIHQKVVDTGFKLEKEKISHRNQLFSRLYRNL